jgi:hypothetical protein
MEAIPAKFSIVAFQWAYPEAKKIQPYFDNLIKNESKPSVIDEITAGAKVSGEVTGEIEKTVKDNMPVLEKKVKRLNELLDEKDLSPSAPQGQPR